MNERGKKLEPKLGLDMPFGEALERFAKTKPTELGENIAKSKSQKSADEKKTRPQKKP